MLEFETERQIPKLLNADCGMPVGAFSKVTNGKIELIISTDCKKQYRAVPILKTGLILQKVGERVVNNGKVYLVGAGCGDYDLITLRGQNCLKNAMSLYMTALPTSCCLSMRIMQKKFVSENEQESIVKSRRI